MSNLRRFTFGSGTVDYNFDVTANWSGNGVTSAATFISFMNGRGMSSIVITAFNLIGNRLQMAYSASAATLDLRFLSVTDYQKGANSVVNIQNLDLNFNGLTIFDPIEPCPVNLLSLLLSFNPISYINTNKINFTIRSIYVGVTNTLSSFVLNRSLPNLNEINLGSNRLSTLGITAVQPNLTFLDLGNGNTFSAFEYGNLFPNLQFLGFSSQQFVRFNPTIPLSNTVNTILFNGCRFTTQGYIDSEPWANAMSVIPSRGSINFQDNPASAIGTNLKTILEAKGFTVLAN